MENMITDFVFNFLIFFLPNDVLTIKSSSKSFLNSAFNGYEIHESYISRVNDYSLTQCSILCTETPSCVSLNYNKISKTCVLFDKDFIHPPASNYPMVDGWRYYYLFRDKEIKPVTCNASYTSGICLRYCLNYIHPDPWVAYTELESECSSYPGGQMVIIDRQLKNHCVKELLEKENAIQDNVYIQGKRNVTTNQWTYNDGTPITYFNWRNDQPNNGVNEIYLAFMHMLGSNWDDVIDDKNIIHATVCQQT